MRESFISGRPIVRRDPVVGVPCVVVAIAVTVALASPASLDDAPAAGSRAAARYFASLRDLSEPRRNAGPWDYFGTNELSFHRNYPAVAGCRGAIVGVGFQQNLSLALRADPALYVFLDIEPTVAALVPFFGLLMETHPTRRAWLSRVVGVELSPEEFRRLVEPSPGDVRDDETLEAYLKRQIATVIERVPRERRNAHITALNRLMESEILVHMPIRASQYERILSNLENLTDAAKSLVDYGPRVLPGDKERGLLEFLYNHAVVSFDSRDAEVRRARATWFSSEENYRRTRAMWLEGRFVGMIADIRGPRVATLGRWLRERDLSVCAVYVSNIPEYFHGQERRAIFDNLGRLPLDDDAKLLTTRRSGFDLLPSVRSFRAIEWWAGSGPWVLSVTLVAVGFGMVAAIRAYVRLARRRRAERQSVVDGND